MTYPQPNPYPQQQYAPQPPKKRRRWPWIVGGIFLFLVVVSVANGGGTAAPTAPTAAVPPAAQQPAAAAAPAAAAPVQPAGPATTLEDGTYEVGVDAAPGKYKTAGGDGGFCYWDRTKKNDGSLGDIAQQGVGDGPQTVTIKSGEFFKSQGCGTWSKSG